MTEASLGGLSRIWARVGTSRVINRATRSGPELDRNNPRVSCCNTGDSPAEEKTDHGQRWSVPLGQPNTTLSNDSKLGLMLLGWRWALILCVAGRLAAGQDAPPGSTLRITVTLVQVDVVVTDSHGRHIPDL